jgi:hypothetical protein
MTDGSLPIDLSHVPQVDPADLAEVLWSMPAGRDRTEEVVPAAREGQRAGLKRSEKRPLGKKNGVATRRRRISARAYRLLWYASTM